MKFSEAWLRECVNPSISTEKLCHQLTMAGIEVAGATPIAPPFEYVVIGRVLALNPHPNADRLRVCTVDVGSGRSLNIVCGAKNVAAHMKVPVATIGAVLPGGLEIKAAKLRGVDSEGMICSEKELGLALESDGIMVLPEDAPIGQNIREYLRLDDHIIEVELTANRADCLSILGVAREVALANSLELKPLFRSLASDLSYQQKDHDIDITLQARAACPRYFGRVIKGIRQDAKTPLWLVERLRRSGIRSIHPAVDITNYLLMSVGQPMHAFDLDQLTGGIHVRFAHSEETLKLLDGNTAHLKANTLLIADEKGPLALAGIMGGLESSVTDRTQNLFLESAYFDPTHLAGKARQYGLHTDASHRFERGVDPTLARQALEWATDLILEILGGEAGPVIGAEHPEALPQPKSIFLRESRLKTLLGRSVPADQVNAILKGLSLSPERQTEGWSVRVPSFRFDLNLEVDLIEEIARIVGFETFTPELPMTHWVNEGFSEKKLPSLRIKTLLADRGFLEAITYSFIDPKWKPWFYGEVTSPTLTNPISPDMAQMRGSLLPGLLEAVKNNRNRQMSRVHLFEMGRVFHDPLEIERLAAVKFGDQRAIEWDGNRLVDYFDLKGDLEAVLTLTHQKVSFKSAEDVQYLHPGQSARVFLEEKPIGVIGKLHPNVIRFLDFKGDIFVFEIDLAEVLSTQKPAFAPISKYPSIARDLALVVDEVLPVADILNAVRSSMGSILVDLNVFDVYAGAGIPEGKKSVALSLILQDLSHTLTELDINEKMNQLLSMLSTQFKATLRE